MFGKESGSQRQTGCRYLINTEGKAAKDERRCGMTLDEAIYHAREVAEKNYEAGMLCHANPDDEELEDAYCEYAKDHLQFAEWLEDYKRLKLLEEESQFTTYNSSNETEEVYEKTKSCENCKYDDKGADEYPCVECCERYLLKFEPKPEKPEMKPCPCCGGKAGTEKVSWDWVVECEECHLSTRVYPTPEEAAKAWNRRA